MRYFFIFIFMVVSVVTLGQREISLTDVKDHIGDSVTIRARIYEGKFLQSIKGSPTFLNVGDNYPNAPLTLVIWDKNRSKFQNAPEDYYKGKDVSITGKLVLYKDKPEIVITDPSQIKEQ